MFVARLSITLIYVRLHFNRAAYSAQQFAEHSFIRYPRHSQDPLSVIGCFRKMMSFVRRWKLSQTNRRRTAGRSICANMRVYYYSLIERLDRYRFTNSANCTARISSGKEREKGQKRNTRPWPLGQRNCRNFWGSLLTKREVRRTNHTRGKKMIRWLGKSVQSAEQKSSYDWANM